MEHRERPEFQQISSENGQGDSKDELTQTAEVLFFHRYRFIRELGRGGMGIVYLTHDTALGIDVAVKRVPESVVNDAEVIKHLRQEVLRGMALAHPGIVRIHNFERDETGAGIVMEYVDGHSLADLKQQQPGSCFDPGEILPLPEQICATLDYAHREAHIVHRDLKPQNIMITGSGKPKIADFGLAALVTESMTRHSMEGKICGTLGYMSPQQAQGMKPTPLDDIYALGATIYDLVTSKPPFFRGSPATVHAQVINVVAQSMSERRMDLGVSSKSTIPLGWESTVAACLAKNPNDRPASGREVFDLLNRSSRALTPLETSDQSSCPSLAEIPPPARSDYRSSLVSWLLAAIAIIGGVSHFLRDTRVEESSSIRKVRLTPRPKPSLAKFETPLPGASAKPLPVNADTRQWLPASIESPYVNSLKMKFVPVPGTYQTLISIWETRVKDYREFARSTQRGVQVPSFSQTDDHPAVMITWDDAQAFCDWLTGREQSFRQLPAHSRYRLPTDREWSLAVGIGETESFEAGPNEKNTAIPDVYPWGTAWPPPGGAGNLATVASRYYQNRPVIADYSDGFTYTAPVGIYQPNINGIYDLSGNVLEWCEDWYDHEQQFRVMRGGSYESATPGTLWSSARYRCLPDELKEDRGFRIVIDQNN
jgi:serine/threonine protein kinase